MDWGNIADDIGYSDARALPISPNAQPSASLQICPRFASTNITKDENCRYMAALCMHARGQVDEATRSYDALLSLKPGHQAWYTRECCVYLWSNIRRPWRDYSPDAELDPQFKVRRGVGVGDEGDVSLLCFVCSQCSCPLIREYPQPTSPFAVVGVANLKLWRLCPVR